TPAKRVGLWTYVRHVETAAQNHHVDRIHHHIYLESPLGQWVQGRSYTIQGPPPVGVQAFLFDARRTLCESIHVNQAGYSGRSRTRYAVFGAFLGTLGSQDFFSRTPFFYEVRRDADDALILTGTSRFWGDDTRNEGGSGEQAVYHMDLSPLDEGRYYLDVPGVGRSHPFGVGEAYSKEIAKTVLRGLYHQRCGTALKPAFTPWARGACHTAVEVTDGEPPGFIPPSPNAAKRPIAGGWHDAGDFDRRGPHIVIPAFLLTLYEAFPDRFQDGEFDIPESGDPFGMPDILDEALWGILLWQNLQEPDGGVRWGVETDAHPVYGVVTAATDTLVYRTYRRDRYVTALAAGLFAQASRLIRPFDPGRAGQLARDARRAWDYAFPDDGENGALGVPFDAERRRPISESGRLYAALQLWLLHGRPVPIPADSWMPFLRLPAPSMSAGSFPSSTT
ncbi:MAG: glycoside hydrolase family 9 protein, partial [Planctomycetota bacterium]